MRDVLVFCGILGGCSLGAWGPGDSRPLRGYALKVAASAGLGTEQGPGGAEPQGHRARCPLREIINGVTVTDEDNNELGRSRVSAGGSGGVDGAGLGAQALRWG